MKVAVTGARGFIGRHVLAELARRGVEVIATERPGVARVRAAVSDVRWVALDIASPPVDAFATLQRPDVLLHLAWDGLPNYRSPHHVESELPRQFEFLSHAVRHGLPALVVAGTCFEYGLRKRLQQLKAVHAFDLTWARLFYTYGDDQPGASLFPMLKAAVAAGHTEFPMSGGEQLRDYLPVDEVARRLVNLAVNPADRGPINVCSGRPISVRQLVESWIGQNGWNIVPKYGELPYSDLEPMAFWGESDDVDRLHLDEM
jgi:nucleoside-diphosphate-sugar epimerase